MIRVTIEVVAAGHDFTIRRETEVNAPDTVGIVERLSASAVASMKAALTTAPEDA